MGTPSSRRDSQRSADLQREMHDVQRQIDDAQKGLHNTVSELKQAQGYQYSPNAPSGLDDNTERSFMIQWLLKEKISTHTIDLLLKEDFCSVDVLDLCSEPDFDSMGISIGQKRLLQAALRRRLAGPGGKNDGGPLPSTNTVDKSGQFPCNFFLGMGVRGSQAPYMDICEFVSVRSPYEGVSDSKTLITSRSDGSFEVKPQSFGKRITLDKVSVSQWVEANTLIMNQLCCQGVSGQSYMGYTVMISQLMQKYDWLSVLLFDREYRKMQANLGFEWGTDQSHLRDVLLLPMPPKEGKGAHDSGGQHQPSGVKTGKFQQKNKQQHKQSQGSGAGSGAKDEETKFKLCMYFNEGKCTRRICPFKHFCTRCGATDHGEKTHRESPNV